MNRYISKYFEAYISYIGSQPNLLDTVVPQPRKRKFNLHKVKSTWTLSSTWSTIYFSEH